MNDTRLKIAVVCSSNQNRSMEAHNFLRYNNVCMYVYGSLTLSILTITQRHGDDGVVSSKCSVGNGRVRDEGWGDRWGVGGLGRFVCGGGECALCIG